MRTPAADKDEPSTASGSDFVQSLERGLAVIQAFSAKTPRLTLSDVARATGLTRAASRRFLLTLQQLGFVDSDDREFFLTPRILRLGYTYLSSTPFWDLAQTHIEDLVDKVHESSSISVLDRDEIVYVARVPTKRIMTISLAVGSRLPLYPTSMGRVLLAGLPPAQAAQILGSAELPKLTRHTLTKPTALVKQVDAARKQQWCLVCEELEEGLVSLSVPVLDRSGHCVAAMNISGQLNRTPPAYMIEHFLPKLQAASAEISSLMRIKP